MTGIINSASRIALVKSYVQTTAGGRSLILASIIRSECPATGSRHRGRGGTRP